MLQLGSGTALPGVVAAKVGGIVTFSDNAAFQNCLENCKDICALNNLLDVEIKGITWGVFTESLIALKPPDIILASDCFYDKKGKIIGISNAKVVGIANFQLYVVDSMCVRESLVCWFASY